MESLTITFQLKSTQQALKQHAINSVFHYVPLHSSPMGESYGYKSGDFPVTESTSNRLVRLPFYTDLSVKNQNFVIKTICNFK